LASSASAAAWRPIYSSLEVPTVPFTAFNQENFVNFPPLRWIKD
jgi:hypothetical protein